MKIQTSWKSFCQKSFFLQGINKLPLTVVSESYNFQMYKSMIKRFLLLSTIGGKGISGSVLEGAVLSPDDSFYKECFNYSTSRIRSVLDNLVLLFDLSLDPSRRGLEGTTSSFLSFYYSSANTKASFHVFTCPPNLNRK